MRKRSEANATPGEEIETEKPPRKTYNFKSAHARTSKDAELRDDLVQIVETVWVEDMNASWKRIKAALQPIGTRRSEHGILAKKLDEARALSYEAHCLYVTAQREFDRWELENEVVNAAMWNEATAKLEQERADKARSKPMTDTDVRSKIMTLHPDEYIAQETKRRAVKLTVTNMSQLVKEANEVVEDYRILLAKLRG
jgi:hypothetical protein